jgi:hypothetical protein
LGLVPPALGGCQDLLSGLDLGLGRTHHGLLPRLLSRVVVLGGSATASGRSRG